ncbi:unnamed protein product, partial [Prorocentrum cordatum]
SASLLAPRGGPPPPSRSAQAGGPPSLAGRCRRAVWRGRAGRVGAGFALVPRRQEGLAHMGGRSRHGTVFLVLGGAVALGLKAAAFVSAPSVPTIRRGVRLENGVQTIIRRGAAAAASTPQGADAAPAKAAAKPDDKDIDDAVLRMAMAMAEDEESPKPATGKAQEEGFDFSILVSLFWTLKSMASEYVGKVEMSATSRNLLTKILQKHFLFSSLEDEERNQVVEFMTTQKASAGDKVFSQGELGDCCYFIQSGVYVVSIDGKNLKQLTKKNTFGELAMLYSVPRTASVTCKEDGVLWKMDEHTFRSCMQNLSEKHLHRAIDFLSSDPSFCGMNDAERKLLAGACSVQSFGPQETILREGEVGDWMFIVMKGSVTTVDRPVSGRVRASFVGAFRFDGDRCPVSGAKAFEATECLALGKHALERLIGPVEDVLRRSAIKASPAGAGRAWLATAATKTAMKAVQKRKGISTLATDSLSLYQATLQADRAWRARKQAKGSIWKGYTRAQYIAERVQIEHPASARGPRIPREPSIRGRGLEHRDWPRTFAGLTGGAEARTGREPNIRRVSPPEGP